MSEWSIRPYAPDDASRVAALLRTCYGDAATPQHIWQWRHFGFDPARSNTLVATVGDEVVGLRPMELYDFSISGRSVSAGVFSGVMVHPEYRRQGLFTRLVALSEELAWERGASFVMTMPNDLSFAGFIKRGYINPGERRLLVRPLRPLSAMARKSSRLHTLRPFLEKLDAFASFTWIPWTAQKHAIQHQEPEGFCIDYDRLADKHSRIHAGVVLKRNSQWLSWRYSRSPWDRYDVLEARSGRGELEGYAVGTTEEREGLRVGYIVDVLTIRRRRARQLIRNMTEQHLQSGQFLVLAVVSDPKLVQDFMTNGFFPMPGRISPKRFYTVVRPNPTVADSLLVLNRISNWYLTLGDWDTI